MKNQWHGPNYCISSLLFQPLLFSEFTSSTKKSFTFFHYKNFRFIFSLILFIKSSLFPNLHAYTSTLGSFPIVSSCTWTFGSIVVFMPSLTLNFDSFSNVSSSMCIVDKSILWIIQISLGSTLDPRQPKGINSYGFPRSSIFSLILYKIWGERHILSTKVILACPQVV